MTAFYIGQRSEISAEVYTYPASSQLGNFPTKINEAYYNLTDINLVVPVIAVYVIYKEMCFEIYVYLYMLKIINQKSFGDLV